MSSSRNNTPWCASETSPGRRNVEPPPSRPASDTEWCGARNGRDVSTPRSRKSPATEWSCVASSASSRESSGRIVARRRASIVLPAPGGPTIRRLCPPAAATSSARRACACPRISDRSTLAAASVGGAAPGSIAGGSHVPRRKPATSANVDAPTTRSDPICAASSALAAGTTTPFSPARAAAIATDRMPGVGSSSPLSESSPANAYPTTAGAGTCAVAVSTPTATGRSSPGPSLRRLAGARLTTTRRSGHSSPALSTAGRTRSRASFTDAPGRPVKTSDGNPRPTYASTDTRCPPTPSTVTATTRPYTRGTLDAEHTLDRDRHHVSVHPDVPRARCDGYSPGACCAEWTVRPVRRRDPDHGRRARRDPAVPLARLRGGERGVQRRSLPHAALALPAVGAHRGGGGVRARVGRVVPTPRTDGRVGRGGTGRARRARGRRPAQRRRHWRRPSPV